MTYSSSNRSSSNRSDPNRPPYSSEQSPGYSADDPTLTQWPPPVDPRAPTGQAAPTAQTVLVEPVPLDNLQNAPHTPPPAPAAKPKRRRSLFWAGFALGFLLLGAASCGVSAAWLGLNRLSLADLRGGSGPAWTPAPVTPTAVAAQPEQAQAGAPAAGVSTRFAAGETVRNLTSTRVNIRATPGYLGKTTADVIGVLDPNETFTVIGESAAADNLTWWHVRKTNGQPVEGWVAEATASGVQIIGSNR